MGGFGLPLKIPVIERIHDEPGQIAAGLALNLIRKKNRQIMVARSASTARDDAIRKKSYDDGYQAGYENGMKDAAARGPRNAKEM